MTGCQSTSLPCVYIGQQSCTRLVALQECNPKVPALLLLYLLHLLFSFLPIFFIPSFILLWTHSFPFSSLSFCCYFCHFPSAPLLPLIIPSFAPSPLTLPSPAPFLSFCHLLFSFPNPPFSPFSLPNRHSPSTLFLFPL